ncbi:MAG: Lrp/AsnC family transcriptional regulator, partial [Thermomicrobiales bacterium]
MDEQILAALQENGRLTMKALAEQVGLSSPAMIERVRRLEERGVISGYRAVVEPAALGRPVTALLTVTVQRSDQQAFQDVLREQSSVSEVYRTTGDASHLIKIHVPDMVALEQFVDELSDTGARCQTTIVMSQPVAFRPVTPPEGTTVHRSRLARRRRRTVETNPDGETVRRAGRPRGRRAA